MTFNSINLIALKQDEIASEVPIPPGKDNENIIPFYEVLERACLYGSNQRMNARAQIAIRIEKAAEKLSRPEVGYVLSDISNELKDQIAVAC